MRVCHLSDLHAGISKNHDNFIEQTFDKLTRKNFDHLIITGDLTNSASDEEFEFLNHIFDKYSLNDSNKLTVIPGNHDLYSPFFKDFQSIDHVTKDPGTMWKFLKFHFKYSQKRYIGEVNNFVKKFAPLFENVITVKDSIAGFPFVKFLSNDVAIIGIDSNDKASLLKNPACSTGEIRKKTLTALNEIFQKDEVKKRMKIVAMHHYLHPLDFMQSKIKNASIVKFIQLYNRDSLITLLDKYNVDLVLHGHYHINTKYWAKETRLPVLNGGASMYGNIKIINIEGGEVFI